MECLARNLNETVNPDSFRVLILARMTSSLGMHQEEAVTIIKLIIILLVAATGVMLTILNPGDVTLNYYFGTGNFPLAFVIAGIFILGALFGFILTVFSLLKSRSQASKCRQQLRETRSELNNLRRIPLNNS